jgi:GxxExxY protein
MYADIHENDLMTRILDCAFEVHRELGPGLFESAYEHCLHHELKLLYIQVDRQHILPVNYKGEQLDCGYRLDLWVERKIIVEVKAVLEVHPVFKAQVLTYLRMTGNKLGVVLNFNVLKLKDGIYRVVNGL